MGRHTVLTAQTLALWMFWRRDVTEQGHIGTMQSNMDILVQTIWNRHFGTDIFGTDILVQTFCHRHFATEILPQTFCHRHFATDILAQTFWHRYFGPDILAPGLKCASLLKFPLCNKQKLKCSSAIMSQC